MKISLFMTAFISLIPLAAIASDAPTTCASSLLQKASELAENYGGTFAVPDGSELVYQTENGDVIFSANYDAVRTSAANRNDNSIIGTIRTQALVRANSTTCTVTVAEFSPMTSETASNHNKDSGQRGGGYQNPWKQP